MCEVDDRQRFTMRRVQVNRWCDAHLTGFFPSRSTKTPFVARLETRKPKLGPGRDQIVSAVEAIIQEFGRDRDANCVHAMIHLAGIAAAIPKKSCERVVATGRQVLSKHIAGFGLRFGHTGTGSDLLAAVLSTPQ